MTYALLCLPFLAAAAAVTVLSARRPRFGRRMAASAVAAAVLVLLTAAFDNLMIAAGLFTYPESHLLGVKVGQAPIEDFAYPVSAAFAVPAAFVLLPERRRP
ncbi:lycopene cyclase domain-containing protein [Glycomyces terrestris]|uniref:Lycopene cyclase domain-containing protein n=1 Tax=Glycomyces terrestris TaxID=2493553 RepID=A0A426V350_9ACTN|nr:lycopene cyclase domain-containing protein [Glycomyces terrestris]RRS01286.1 lycopene cyclase domain-containing protein [Glycomyces terrestris]